MSTEHFGKYGPGPNAPYEAEARAARIARAAGWWPTAAPEMGWTRQGYESPCYDTARELCEAEGLGGLVAVLVQDGGLSGRRWAGYVVTRAVRADGRLWSLPSLPEHVKAATRISGGRVLYGRKAEALRAAAAYGEVLPGFYRGAGNGHPFGLIVPATVDAMGKPFPAAA